MVNIWVTDSALNGTVNFHYSPCILCRVNNENRPGFIFTYCVQRGVLLHYLEDETYIQWMRDWLKFQWFTRQRFVLLLMAKSKNLMRRFGNSPLWCSIQMVLKAFYKARKWTDMDLFALEHPWNQSIFCMDANKLEFLYPPAFLFGSFSCALLVLKRKSQPWKLWSV